MRHRKLKQSWRGANGRLCRVDAYGTLHELKRLLHHDQCKDAYWEAIDILREEAPLVYDGGSAMYWERYNYLNAKLHSMVTSDTGYLNRGVLMFSGAGKVWWEARNKSDAIRWAIADSIL